MFEEIEFNDLKLVFQKLTNWMNINNKELLVENIVDEIYDRRTFSFGKFVNYDLKSEYFLKLNIFYANYCPQKIEKCREFLNKKLKKLQNYDLNTNVKIKNEFSKNKYHYYSGGIEYFPHLENEIGLKFFLLNVNENIRNMMIILLKFEIIETYEIVFKYIKL